MAIHTINDTSPAIAHVVTRRATGVSSGGIACTTYQNDNDCRPSTIATGKRLPACLCFS